MKGLIIHEDFIPAMKRIWKMALLYAKEHSVGAQSEEDMKNLNKLQKMLGIV